MGTAATPESVTKGGILAMTNVKALFDKVTVAETLVTMNAKTEMTGADKVTEILDTTGGKTELTEVVMVVVGEIIDMMTAKTELTGPDKVTLAEIHGMTTAKTSVDTGSSVTRRTSTEMMTGGEIKPRMQVRSITDNIDDDRVDIPYTHYSRASGISNLMIVRNDEEYR
jgi:hypothetical protein